MKTYFALFLFIAPISPAFAQQAIRQIDLAQESVLQGEVIAPTSPQQSTELKISAAAGVEFNQTLLRIEKPAITQVRYALSGKIRYSDIAKIGYLEMLNHFPEGQTFFTRTLSESGPLKHLEGSAKWRGFSLPFVADSLQKSGAPSLPSALELRLILPQGGTVWLKDLQLTQFAHNKRASNTRVQHLPHAWWNERLAGAIGGIAGAVLGLLGGLIGCLAGTGKARRFVLALVRGAIFAGLVMLIAGAEALRQNQPSAVYMTLLLTGGVTLLAFSCIHNPLKKRYAEKELRKMEAKDL